MRDYERYAILLLAIAIGVVLLGCGLWVYATFVI